MTEKRKTIENTAEAEKQPDYTLTLTAEQARVLSRAANLYARVLRGQWDHLPGEILDCLPVYADIRPLLVLLDRDEYLCEKSRLIERQFSDVLAREPYRGNPAMPYELSCIAFDLHETLRHQLWQDDEKRSHASTHSAKPFKWARSQPLPAIGRVTSGEPEGKE